jgi:hypothetical protein
VLDLAHVPPVEPNELLSRFILFSRHVRADKTVRPDAFVPHPLPELSLTRHRDATDDELWREGERVEAAIREATLYGRAEVVATAFLDQQLSIEAKPIPANPNHVDVTNWPAEKSAQKMKALEIAKVSSFQSKPD